MKQILISIGILLYCASTQAATTIDPAHKEAYGANIGWINAQGDTANGMVVGQAYCTGYIYSANCGWIGLGNSPNNGWHYSNTSSGDWGVNHDGAGNLTGNAYGANIGWITFEQTFGRPKIDLRTGNLSGYAWAANVGWISLSNAQAFVRSAQISNGPDSDSDGIADSWELQSVGNLTTLHGGGHDQDNDGVSDKDEYLADTNPLDDEELLRIVELEIENTARTVTWLSRPTRLYRLEATNRLSAATGNWEDVGGGLLGPMAASTASCTEFDVTTTSRFYRVRAFLPLTN